MKAFDVILDQLNTFNLDVHNIHHIGIIGNVEKFIKKGKEVSREKIPITCLVSTLEELNPAINVNVDDKSIYVILQCTITFNDESKFIIGINSLYERLASISTQYLKSK